MAALAFVAALGAQLLDRTVAVVGSQPITASEVELQMRLQALFGEASLDLSDQARDTALERLIEQRLIESDMALAALPLAEPGELDVAFERLRGQRFGELAFGEALERYGVSEADAREFLRKQLRFARYVRFRFRAGLQVEEGAIEAAYRKGFADVAEAPPLEQVRGQLREQALDEQAERMLDDRVRQLRAETRVARLERIDPEAAP